MKPTLIAAAALLLGAGSSIALVVQSGQVAELESQLQALRGVPTPGAPGNAPHEERCLQRDQVLESRLAALQLQVAQLRQAGGLPAVAAGTALAGSGGASAEPETLKELVTEDPEVREVLKDVVKEEQQRLHQERHAQRQQRWAERSRERVQELAREHGFSDAQVQGLQAHLDEERSQIQQLFEQRGENLRFREVRQQIRGVREQTDQAVKELLDETQYKAYQQMREDDWPGRRGGRHGRGPDAPAAPAE